MAKKFGKLRGRIVELFGSQKNFAQAIGLTEVSITNKLNGKFDFTLKEIMKWCELLDIQPDDVSDYFFRP